MPDSSSWPGNWPVKPEDEYTMLRLMEVNIGCVMNGDGGFCNNKTIDAMFVAEHCLTKN